MPESQRVKLVLGLLGRCKARGMTDWTAGHFRGVIPDWPDMMPIETRATELFATPFSFLRGAWDRSSQAVPGARCASSRDYRSLPRSGIMARLAKPQRPPTGSSNRTAPKVRRYERGIGPPPYPPHGRGLRGEGSEGALPPKLLLPPIRQSSITHRQSPFPVLRSPSPRLSIPDPSKHFYR